MIRNSEESASNNAISHHLSFIEVKSHDQPQVSLCQALRLKVFVEEQGIPAEVEVDGKDHSPLTHHLLVQTVTSETPTSGNNTIGTGRIVFSRNDDDDLSSSLWTVSLGRIAVAKEWRKRGIGKQIVQTLEAIALKQSERVVYRLVLTPHSYLEAFYTSLGFSRVPGGDKIVNENCKLITMEKKCTASPKTTPCDRKRRICLFGTSANPPTGAGGHGGIVQALLDLKSQPNHPDSEPLYDEVHVLPVYRHTFAAKKHELGQVSYDHRVAMCRLAFGPLSPRVVVSRAEERSYRRCTEGIMDPDELATLRVGTVDLLDMLLEETKHTEFSFCLGADTFMDLTAWKKWKRSKDVLRLLEGRLEVVHRKGLTFENELQDRVQHVNAKEGGRVTFLDVPELEVVSSTMAREAKDKEHLRKLIPESVVDYIAIHKLYGFGES